MLNLKLHEASSFISNLKMSSFNDVNSGKNLEPEDIANAVLYAVTQPDYVGVNEILVQPRDMPF